MHKIILFLFFSPLVLFGQGVAKNIVKNIVPLETNINQFKYIIYQEIYSNKPKDKRTLLKVLNEKLKSKSYVVVTTLNSEYHPEELTLNPDIGLYLSAKSERRGIFKFVSFVLSDYYGNIIHQREVDHDRSVKYLFGLVLQDFISMPHRFNPDVITKSKKRKVITGEWAGNGSGIIISKAGHIITNHHVIEDADDVEVEFILNDEVQKFNAEIVQSDKVNDLAIIKIVDVNFDGVKELPYNFTTRSVDVATEIFVLGYPMALTLMGKDIKFTDGKISSKTGLDGDITSYTISAPILPGNSGGPLFDTKGNLIGINSAGLARGGYESVGYSIKTSYVSNLLDILPKRIDLPSSNQLQSLPLTEQIKEISKYVVLIKVK